MNITKKLGPKVRKEDFYFIYPQEEDPDWGYARNRFFALKRTDCCWSASLFSVKEDGFLTPNRDYPYQGLLTVTENGYRKFLDSFMFRVKADEVLDLEPTKAKISPWKAVYFYENEDTVLRVEHYLSDLSHKNRTGGWIKFEFESSQTDELEIEVLPLVDFRHIYAESPPADSYELIGEDSYLDVRNDEEQMLIGPFDSFDEGREARKWNYKLGDGERKRTEEGLVFKSVVREPVCLGSIVLKLGEEESRKLSFACGKGVSKDLLKEIGKTDEEKDLKKTKEILNKFELNEDSLKTKFLRSRLLSLLNFGRNENGMDLPEAGEWWFKEIWFRDLFESVYHEMEFYRKTKGDDWLMRLFKWARIYVKNGVMANKPSRGEIRYNSLDASLLYLLCMGEFYETVDDSKYRERIERIFKELVETIGDMDGLLSCPANYSWIDSKLEGRPTRIPDGWDLAADEDFLLPEVNALWIKVLESYNRLFGGDVDIKQLVAQFRETFWDEEKQFVYQTVYRDGKRDWKDDTESSVGVMTLALLSNHFHRDEIDGAWRTIEDSLLVTRKPFFFEKEELPFGVLVKNSDEKIYLDDKQYHEATVWLRDTVYLCKLLRSANKDKTAQELEKNVLDHQMSEGAIFYNHELFSLPGGKNPASGPFSSNPVPVKNPVQLWSHFLPEIQERG